MDNGKHSGALHLEDLSTKQDFSSEVLESFPDVDELNCQKDEFRECSECASKAEYEQNALHQLINLDDTTIPCGHRAMCSCQKKEPTAISKRPDGLNWHLVSAWGDNTQDGPQTPIKQPKSAKKLRKTVSQGSIKKGCFPSYFKHHSDYSLHMEDYKNFVIKYYNTNSNPDNEAVKEQMLVLPDLSSKAIQIGDQEDPYLNKLVNSQNLVERFLLLTDMDETFQRTFAPNPNRKLKQGDQELSRRTEETPPSQFFRHPNLAQIRLQKSLARTDSGIKSAPPMAHNKSTNNGHSLVDLKFPTNSSLPVITNSHPDGSFAKYLNSKNKVQTEKSSLGSASVGRNSAPSSQNTKSLQPPNLAVYKNFLSNKGKAGTFRGFKDGSGTLVLGSTVNNMFTRKNKDFVHNNFLSRNKKETTDGFPIQTSSLPTMTMP